MKQTEITEITEILQIDDFDDEYVYDLGISGKPYFFANDLLVHNSVYFSATSVMPDDEELTLDNATKLYDHISNEVSKTFPAFLKKTFNVSINSGEVIKAGREVIGSAGIFITKKRYAIKCLDIDGKKIEGGKLKIMGLDIKRVDTPKYMQDFLAEILEKTLDGYEEDKIIDRIQEFRDEFKKMLAWKKGMTKSVNRLTHYRELLEAGNTRRVPGHVTASLNYNKLRSMNTDSHSLSITDGSKIMVCRLKTNPLNFKTIAYPIDDPYLPEWFLELPFDEDEMEKAVLDKKLKNLLGVLNWDIGKSNQSYAKKKYFS